MFDKYFKISLSLSLYVPLFPLSVDQYTIYDRHIHWPLSCVQLHKGNLSPFPPTETIGLFHPPQKIGRSYHMNTPLTTKSTSNLEKTPTHLWLQLLGAMRTILIASWICWYIIWPPCILPRISFCSSHERDRNSCQMLTYGELNKLMDIT